MRSNFVCLLLIILCASLVLAQQNYVEIEGKVESFQYDGSSGSGYLFYLATQDRRYKIESSTPIPVELAGTSVKVKGTILGNSLFVDSSSGKAFEIMSSPSRFPEEALEQQSPSEESSLKLSWLYIALPLAITFGLLGLFEWHRIKGHKEIAGMKKQHLITALRNYAAANIKKGYSKEQISSALIKHNYSKEYVDEAFRLL